jgi:hypothetical protein
MYDRPVSTTRTATRATSAPAAAASWRPQRFSEVVSRGVVDPIVEPLWTGLRVIALASRDGVAIRDLDGDAVHDFPDIAAELAVASRTDTLVVDAYLTHQPLQSLAVVARRDSVEDPKAAPGFGQLMFGSLGRRRRREPQAPAADTGREPLPAEGDVALVAVDLLWLDDDSLLDVPLLERKRILESVLAESRLVRRGIYVRPPIDTWIGSWRTMGFTRLAYKGANSRYLPGETNSQWALADLPSR